MAGQPGEPIEGMDSFNLPGGVACAMDDYAIIAARNRDLLSAAVSQYRGSSEAPALESEKKAFGSLDGINRSEDALTFWLDTRAGLEVARSVTAHDQEAMFALRAADGYLNIRNTESLWGRVVLDAVNPFMEAGISLGPEYGSAAYELIRTVPINKTAFETVPADALFACSASLNDTLRLALQHGAALLGVPLSSTAMENIQQVTFFMVPPSPAMAQDFDDDMVPLLFGLSLTAEDIAAVRGALDEVAYNIAGLAQGPRRGVPLRDEVDEKTTRYFIADAGDFNVHLYVAEVGDQVIVTWGEDVARAARAAAQSGGSALTEGAIGARMSTLEPDVCALGLVNVPAALRMVAWAASVDDAPAEVTAAMEALAGVFAGTTVQLSSLETDEEVRVRLGVNNLPAPAEVSPIVMQLMHVSQQARADARARYVAAAQARRLPVPEPVGVPLAAARITVDGDLSDWGNVAQLPAPRIVREGKSACPVWVAWRPEGLYVAARVTDDGINLIPEEPWRGDCLELFLEPGAIRSSERSATSGQLAFAPTMDGSTTGFVKLAWGGPHFQEAAGAASCGWSAIEGGYAIEAFVPARALRPMSVVPGETMSFNYVLSNDGEWTQQFYSDKTEGAGFWRPETWGLIGLDVEAAVNTEDTLSGEPAE
jgi:hypothetical protein